MDKEKPIYNNGALNIINQEIVGKTIEVGYSDVADRIVGCSIEDCVINIHCSGRVSSVTLSENNFKNCIIKSSKKQEITNLTANFKNCKFIGVYEIEFKGSVINCNFENAKINYALFFEAAASDENIFSKESNMVFCNLSNNWSSFRESITKFSSLWLLATKKPLVIVCNLNNLKKISDKYKETLNKLNYVKYIGKNA